MKQVGLVILMATLGGCIHWRSKAPVAPPEVAAGIQFPEWTKETTTTVEGPRLKALQVWLMRGDGMTFIHFTPREAEWCSHQPEVMDPGASYAISDEGVILKRD